MVCTEIKTDLKSKIHFQDHSDLKQCRHGSGCSGWRAIATGRACCGPSIALISPRTSGSPRRWVETENSAELVAELDELHRHAQARRVGRALQRTRRVVGAGQHARDVLADPQANAAGMFVEMAGIDGEQYKSVSTPVRFEPASDHVAAPGRVPRWESTPPRCSPRRLSCGPRRLSTPPVSHVCRTMPRPIANTLGVAVGSRDSRPRSHGRSRERSAPEGGEHGFGELLAADEEIREPRVGAVVDERRSVEASDVKSGRHRHSGGRGAVPLVLAAGVHVDVGVAAHDRHGLGACGSERDDVHAQAVRDHHRGSVRRAAATGDHTEVATVDRWGIRRRIAGAVHHTDCRSRTPTTGSPRTASAMCTAQSLRPRLAELVRAVQRVDDPHNRRRVERGRRVLPPTGSHRSDASARRSTMK